MKLFVALLVSQLSLQALAVSLMAEAECTGKLDGKRIKVEALVNPQNWCSDSADDQNSAILLKEGSDVIVSTTTRSETEVDDALVVVLTSSERNGAVKLTYTIDGVPSTGASKLELIEGSETTTVELKCNFPEYHMDC